MNTVHTVNSRAPILLALAFAAGGAAGFFIAKKLLQEHYREIAQLEIDDVTQYFRDKYEGSNEIRAEKDDDTYRKLAVEYTKPAIKDILNKHQHEEEIEEDDEEFEEEEDDEEFDDSDPKISEISYQDFIDESLGYEKTDLFYYRLDDVICDVNDNVILFAEEILGFDWRDHINRRTTIFIRNDYLETDYEIHALSKSFNDEVAIRLETNKEKQYRRTARQKEVMDAFASSQEYEEIKKREPKTKPYVRPKNQAAKYHDVSLDDDGAIE